MEREFEPVGRTASDNHGWRDGHAKIVDEPLFDLHFLRRYSTVYLIAAVAERRRVSFRPQRWKELIMNAMLCRLASLLRSESGPTATEYAVLIAVICVAAIGALSSFGVHMDNLYMDIASTVPQAAAS